MPQRNRSARSKRDSGGGRQLQRDYLREALWYVYGARCGYSDDQLPGTPGGPEYHIDHIIPESLKDDPVLLSAVLQEFDLEPDFQLQSLRNRIPTTPRLNLLKGVNTTGMWRGAIRDGLRKARANEAAVTRMMTLLAARDAAEQATARERSNAMILPAVHDLLTGTKPWIPHVDVGPDRVAAWESDVYLTCHLPGATGFTGSALLIVRTPGAAEYQLTFSHADVLRWLIPGRNSGVDFGRRPFLRFEHSDQSVSVGLPNGMLRIGRAQVEQLCRAVDIVADHYLAAMHSLEVDLLDSADAEISSTGRCRLASVSLATWRAVRAFADQAPPADCQADAWWLSGSGVPFAVFTQAPETGRRVRAILAAEADGTVLTRGVDAIVHLCWQRPPTLYGPLETALRDGTLWTVRTTAKWLHTTFLPVLAQWVSATDYGEDAFRPIESWWPQRRVRYERIRVAPHIQLVPCSGALPATWTRARQDCGVLMRHATDVCIFAQRTPFLPGDAVPRVRDLLADWIEHDQISHQSYDFLVREFGARDMADVARALRKPSPAAESALVVFRALEVALRDRADTHATRSLTLAAELAAELAEALRPSYEVWWEATLCTRQWRPR